MGDCNSQIEEKSASCPIFNRYRDFSSVHDCAVDAALAQSLIQNGWRPIRVEEYYLTSTALDLLKPDRLVILPGGSSEDFDVYDLNDRPCTCGSCNTSRHLSPRYEIKDHEDGARHATDGERVVWIRTSEKLNADDGRYCVFYHPSRTTVVYGPTGERLASLAEKRLTAPEFAAFLAGYDAANGGRESA